MSLLCLVLFIMPCGRSYLWLIILKQFLYFISVEFPLEDATKEANHANKAYPSRGTQEKKQIMLLHICKNVKFTWAATIHVPFFFLLFFFLPRMDGSDSQSLMLYIGTFPDTQNERISEQTCSRKLKQCFMHFLPHPRVSFCWTVQQAGSANHEAPHPKTVNWSNNRLNAATHTPGF